MDKWAWIDEVDRIISRHPSRAYIEQAQETLSGDVYLVVVQPHSPAIIVQVIDQDASAEASCWAEHADLAIYWMEAAPDQAAQDILDMLHGTIAIGSEAAQ